MENTVLATVTNKELVIINSNNTNTVVIDNTLPSLYIASEVYYITNETQKTLLVTQDISTTVVTGLIGPEGPVGPAGTSEDDVMYSKRIDTISDELLYRGEATVGSSESSDVWRIRKITIVANDITETWASGNANFDKQWSNRLNYSYN